MVGKGCIKCAKEFNVYSREQYINKFKDKECTFYLLKCWNDTEEFYKIGITSQGVKLRYHKRESMPYSYDIIKELFGTPDFVFDLEASMKKGLQSSYQPQIKFAGSVTECYSDLNEILSCLSLYEPFINSVGNANDC